MAGTGWQAFSTHDAMVCAVEPPPPAPAKHRSGTDAVEQEEAELPAAHQLLNSGQGRLRLRYRAAEAAHRHDFLSGAQNVGRRLIPGRYGHQVAGAVTMSVHVVVQLLLAGRQGGVRV